jgi:hypothetical protein
MWKIKIIIRLQIFQIVQIGYRTAPFVALFSVNLTSAIKQNINRKAMNNYSTHSFQIFHVTLRFEFVAVGTNKPHVFVINITML